MLDIRYYYWKEWTYTKMEKDLPRIGLIESNKNVSAGHTISHFLASLPLLIFFKICWVVPIDLYWIAL